MDMLLPRSFERLSGRIQGASAMKQAMPGHPLTQRCSYGRVMRAGTGVVLAVARKSEAAPWDQEAPQRGSKGGEKGSHPESPT